jgi:hypothetical protein
MGEIVPIWRISDESYILSPILEKEVAINDAKSARRCFRAHLPPISQLTQMDHLHCSLIHKLQFDRAQLGTS